jgi:hypothetical protein
MATFQPKPRHSPHSPRPDPVSTNGTSLPAAPVKPAELQFHGRRLLRWVGSVQVAILLLAIFALVLFLGTLVESRHDRRVAQQLVYRTWWFGLLLGLLGANVLFAALKKWPWKRHQVGFLITHLGLITLVISGLLTALSGSTGVLVMVDSAEPQFHGFGLHTTDFVIDRDQQTLRVRKNEAELLRADFDPGPLAWGDGPDHSAALDTLSLVLDWLAHPRPRGWKHNFDETSRLEVLAFYPHSKEQPFNPEAASGQETFPAVEFQLGSSTSGVLAPQWIGYHESRRALPVGPGLVEFLGRNLRLETLAEFNQPVLAGAKGQLVLGFGGNAYRIDVAEALLKRGQSLGDSGWRCTLFQYLPNFKDNDDRKASDPGVAFELTHDEARPTGFAVTARRGGELFPLPNQPVAAPPIKDLWAWYHPPDPRYGDDALRAVLQFATSADGQLHFRTFSSGGERLAFEKAGVVAKGDDWQRVWSGMKFKLQVTHFLSHASPGPYFCPLDHKPVREEEAQPALRCRLTNQGESAEFWLGKTDGGLTPVSVGGDHFQIGYNSTLRPLGFGLTLLKAEQTTDPSSSLPASQSSTVRLRDEGRDVDEEHHITLNEPLEHGGYAIYQTGFAAVGQDAKGNSVSRALLTATRDPGLWFKYTGSTMVALGIACMFYMRAYFFKPKTDR